MYGPECRVSNPVVTAFWVSMLLLSVSIFFYSRFVLASETKKHNINPKENRTEMNCCSRYFSNRTVLTCRYVSLAMAGSVVMASVECYRCSTFPYKKLVKDNLLELATALYSVPNFAALLSISLKWIEVSKTELKLIQKESMIKASNFVTLVKILFAVVYALFLTVARSYVGGMCILFEALIAVFFLGGAQMVQTRLQVMVINPQKKRNAKNMDANKPSSQNRKSIRMLETKTGINLPNQSPKIRVSFLKSVRAKCFMHLHRKVHAGLDIQTKHKNQSLSGNKLPPSAGALAIIRTSRIMSGICSVKTVCYSVYLFYKPTLRFYFLAELSTATIFVLTTLANLCMLRYIRGGNKTAYLLKNLYSNISQGEMIRKFNEQRKRRRRRRGGG